MKTFKEFLNESQTFDFDNSKNMILKYIQKVRKNEKLTDADNPFYNIIVGNVSFTNLFDDDTKNKWKDYFSNKMFDTDGVWSQRNFNQGLERKSGKDRTFNYYITVDKDKNNILLFWNKLGELDKKLQEFSNSKKTPISYKTHRLLDAFVTHNDSLKVYYYDDTLKGDIENIVKEWLKSGNIKFTERTHGHGVDIKGEGGGSFGQVLANVVGEQLKNLIQQHKDKYTDEQYFEWIKKYMPDIIKKVKTKEDMK
jgi:hypothetical protein